MSKDKIRVDVGNFLTNIPNNNNAFRLAGQNQFVTGAEDQLVDENGNLIQEINENPSLTAAAPALLPMQIAVAGTSKDGIAKRLNFTMLINPETWNHSKSNTTQLVYSRSGWIVQPWGPNQDTISSTGRTAGFMLPGVGYTNIGSEMSFGYLNFLSLLGSYKNNGYVFQDFTKIHAITRVIQTVFGIQLSYDNNTYMGHFNNFTIDEDELVPFGLTYNFEFIISTLSGTEHEVRGHYQQIPASEIDLQTGTEGDPRVSNFVGDPYVKPLGKPPIIADDGTTRRIWEQKTGLPWADAISMHLTDDSVTGNRALRKLLLSKTWDAGSKTFI